MAVSYTTTYNLTKPEVGASEDEWGDLLNTNLDELDNILDGTTPVTGIDINSGTIDGTVIGGSTAAAITGTTGQFDTSLNVDGTVTADGLSVDGVSTFTSNVFISHNATPLIRLEDTDTALDFDLLTAGSNATIRTKNGAYPLFLQTDENDRIKIAGNGDISFYEDTGTTPKFFWDASAESLGIGTSSPSAKLDVAETDSVTYSSSAVQGDLVVSRKNSANTVNQVVGLEFDVTGWSGSTTGVAGISAIQTGSNQSSAALAFQTRNAGTVAERMRIDASGNLLVGKSSANIATVGHEINGNGGYASHTRSGNTCLFLNRTTSDGNIAEFRKDGSTVGSISSVFYGMQIYATGVNNTGWTFGDGSAVLPMKNSALSDNFVDLGSASYRMDDIYATNGTIQTSDRNEKQDIEALSDAEQRVAVACKDLLRKFRWIDAVAEKGDDARIHFGIIAQDLQDAFATEGLDAGRYAMFISSTWWETQTDVPAVEAVEAVYEDVVIPAVLDEDGNEVEPERTEQQLVTEAVEAKDAYTRTDTYETLEEAPEGATERTRMGVRYPELLAFIIAAI